MLLHSYEGLGKKERRGKDQTKSLFSRKEQERLTEWMSEQKEVAVKIAKQ